MVEQDPPWSFWKGRPTVVESYFFLSWTFVVLRGEGEGGIEKEDIPKSGTHKQQRWQV
jgi:hypothetical protein